jgi:SsrA-binding protein
MSDKKNSDLVSNRQALHHYEILETFEAGIALTGTEVKSLRDHGGALVDAYVKVLQSELWLLGCSIAPWRFGNIYNHEERRDRKLLMHKREIASIKKAVQEKGLTVIPLGLYLKNGKIKAKIAIAKGKTKGDKRAAIKERDDRRHMEKVLKNYR